MQFPRIAAGVLAASIAAAPRTAQPASAPGRVHEVTAQEVVYAVPGMDRVVVRPDVPFKKIEGGELKLDLYYPPGAKPGAKLPAVVFINGVGDRPDNRLKDWGIYKSWGRLVAASGWIGVNFEARGPYDQSGPDIRDAFAFLRKEAASLGIDAGPDRRLGLLGQRHVGPRGPHERRRCRACAARSSTTATPTSRSSGRICPCTSCARAATTRA